jgi:hypothetical protein
MKRCKPTYEAVMKRMRAAERLNNRNGGTYYGGDKSNGVFPLEIFGINNPSRKGVFTMQDIINELKNG